MIGMRLLSFQKRARLRAVLAIGHHVRMVGGTLLRGRKSPHSLPLSRRERGDTIALDHSIHDTDGPMGVGGHVGIVRDQDDGDALGVEPLEHPQDFNARVRIEVARRLVGQEERGPID